MWPLHFLTPALYSARLPPHQVRGWQHVLFSTLAVTFHLLSETVRSLGAGHLPSVYLECFLCGDQIGGLVEQINLGQELKLNSNQAALTTVGHHSVRFLTSKVFFL